LGSPSEFLQVLYGQSVYHGFRGELDLAQHLDEDLLCLSLQRNDSAGLVLGHLSSGRNLMYGGRFTESRSHLEAGLALYDPISHRSLVHQVGYSPQVLSQAFLGIVLFCLGFPDQALAQSGTAIAEARRLAHPPSLAVNLGQGARLLSLIGDNAALDERAGQLAAVATEQGFSHWRAEGTIFRGWIKVRNGDVAEGISVLRSGSAAYSATGVNSALHHVDIFARLGVKAEIRVILFVQLTDHDRTLNAGILGDLPDRRLDRLADDVDADLLVMVRRIEGCQNFARKQ
jgi:predicted ATPase